MVKLILISLQAIIAINAVLSTNVPAGNGFQYIGSFRSRLSVQGRSTQLFDESNYYISQNWGACNTAQKDCESLLNANLLAVETEEEWKHVRELLKNYGFATSYWTSGEYARTEWRWSANDIALAPFAPWQNGHPKNANALLSVLINYRNRYDATWSTVPNTQLHRYICEEKVQDPSASSPTPPSTPSSTTPSTSPSTTPPAPPSPFDPHLCYQTNDLVIVLDSSESIGRANFEKAKQFVERLASTFTAHSENRVSFITYSYYGHSHIDLRSSSSLSPAEISSKILTARFQAGDISNTSYGIDWAWEELLVYYREVPKNMVIVTAVKSSSPHKTAEIATQASKNGIRTFFVGIAPYLYYNEMLEMFGNYATEVFNPEDFDGLINLYLPLSNAICWR